MCLTYLRGLTLFVGYFYTGAMENAVRASSPWYKEERLELWEVLKPPRLVRCMLVDLSASISSFLITKGTQQISLLNDVTS